MQVSRSAQIFLEELSKSTYDPISRSKELELLNDYQRHEDREAFNALVNSNLRYIAEVASRYSRVTQAHFMDLIQEGVNGLMKAITRYDPSPGYRLLTYANWWIRQSIRQYIDAGAKTAIDSNVSLDELAEADDHAGIDPTESATAGRDFVDHCLVMFYQVLTIREYIIMKLYYGFDRIVGRSLKLREIGEVFKIDAERVRQIINQSHKKLRAYNVSWFE